MVQFYSVTPETTTSEDPEGTTAAGRVRETARRAESIDCAGILVPQNQREIDPWMLAMYVGSVTTRLRPLIAVQPATLPPHTAAAAAAAYGVLFGRALDFNLVAGAREDEMAAIGDTLDHDGRYRRLQAWARSLRVLLRGDALTSDDGFFAYRNLRLSPCPEVMQGCRFFIAGSSPSSRQVATEVADVAVTHPTPFAEWSTTTLPELRDARFTGQLGIRIGLLPRASREEAWALAHERYPRTWLGDQETKLKTISSSTWSKELASRALDQDEPGERSDPYWLGAFRNGGSSAPMLVGSEQEVAEGLGHYVRAGVEHVILTGIDDDDYDHTQRVMAMVDRGA